jgi:hypothetical protein
MDVWAIVYSNYDPPEVHTLWETRELAERVCEKLGESWRVTAWRVGDATEAQMMIDA